MGCLCIFRKHWWFDSKTLLLSLTLINLSLGEQGSDATSQNVALNKTARQSSIYHSLGYADNAVDGDRNQMYNDGSCTHTLYEYNPFWEVDLADIYFIDEIIIYPRWDCCQERTSDVLIELSIDNINYQSVCFNPGILPSNYTCTLENSRRGRWVRVSIQGTAMVPLHICEVEVMSKQAVDRGHFKRLESLKGTGSALRRVSARNQIECVCICSINKNCISINMIQDSDTATGIMCELLQSDNATEASDGTVSFWTLRDLA